LHWLSRTPFQPFSLTSVLAKPMREHLAPHSHPADLGIPDLRCHCCALYRIHRLLRNRVHCHLNYPSHNSSLANLPCSKCFQVRSPCLFQLWQLILWIQRKFKIWVCPPGSSFADKAGGKGDHSVNLNAAAPLCWKNDQDALTVSSMSEMYPTVDICLFWAQDFFSVAHRFWLPCHISKRSWTVAILWFPFLCLFLHFRVVLCVRSIQFWVSACENPVIGLCKLPYKNSFAKGLTCGFWLPPA